MTRHVVHGENGIAREPVKQAFFNHDFGAARVLLCRLKNQVQGAGKCHTLGDVFCCGQQHGGVPVVPAGVHDALMATGVGKGVLLENGQGVHVGAQTQAFCTLATD